jgi:hypothetical protein
MNWEDEVRIKVVDTQTGKRFDVSPKAFKQLYLDHGSRIQLDGTEGANADYAHFADFGRKKARDIEPAFKAVPTGRGVPAYQPRSTGRGVPSHQPVSTSRGAPAYQPVSTGRGVISARETSPVRDYTGYTGDTRGVQESWWDGADMGPGMDYMEQFPQIDGSDDSMREYMMGRRDMSGTIYDPTPSNFVPNAILNKPYTPSPKRQQKPSIWSDAYNSLNSIYDEYSPQLNSIWNNVPNIPADAFDAGEYVLDTYDSMANTASGIWGDFTDWLSGDDEIKAAEAEKAELDKYLEDAKYRYVNIHGVAFDEDARKAAIAQFYKDKRLGKLIRRK